jgi:tRNA(Ile)-lysidine synthetase-like protein
MDLAQHLQAQMREHLGPDFTRFRLLVAVSGGLDSMTLLCALRQVWPADRLVGAHFDHRTRAASGADARFVARHLRALGIAAEHGRRPIPQAEERPPSELALRACRRRFLHEARRRAGCDFIVTAHHAGDQLETFLMRLLRGTGVEGMAGIRPRTGVWLRPLLAVPRVELETAARRWGVAFREDETNRQEIYLRNRVRRRLVPVIAELAREFGGEERFLARFTATVAELQTTAHEIRRRTERRYRRWVVETPFWQQLDLSRWQSQGPVGQDRLARRIFAAAGAPVPDRDTVARLRRAIAAGRRAYQAPGLHVRQSCGRLYFQSPAQQQAWREPRRFRWRAGAWECPELGITVLGVDTAFPGAVVRFFQAGDRFGRGKLKSRFLDRRIPLLERGLVPVIARSGSPEVLWHYPDAHSGLRCAGPAFPLAVAPVPPLISP